VSVSFVKEALNDDVNITTIKIPIIPMEIERVFNTILRALFLEKLIDSLNKL